MLSRFFKPEKEKKSLALDIGTEAVKALAFEKRNGKIVLLGKSLQYLDPFGVWDHGGNFELSTLQKYVGQAVKESQAMAGSEAEKIALAMPPNILRARIQKVSIERDRRHAHISGSEGKELVRKVTEMGKEEVLRSAVKEYGLNSQDISFTGVKIIAISIDGYKVSSLHHFNGKRLEFICLILFFISPQSKKNGFGAVLSDLAKQLKMPLRSLCAFHPAQYLNIFAQHLQDGVYIDIGGKCTQVFLLQDHKLVYVSEFDTGASSFADEIAEAMGLTRESARSFLEQHAEGKLSNEVEERVKEKLAPIANDWFDRLKENLRKGMEAFPPTIFIFGGGSLVPEIRNVLGDGDWGDLVFSGSLQTNVLYPKDLPHRPEDSKNCAISPQDVSPIFLCYAPPK